MDISSAALALWAKKPKKYNRHIYDAQNDTGYLPLLIHLWDTANVMRKLWQSWASQKLKNAIVEGCVDEETAELARYDPGGKTENRVLSTVIICAATHDFGKATLDFAANLRSGDSDPVDQALRHFLGRAGLLPSGSFSIEHKPLRHALMSQILLQECMGLHRSLAIIAGSHHGSTPDAHTLSRNKFKVQRRHYYGPENGPEIEGSAHRRAWEETWKELIDFSLKISGLETVDDLLKPNLQAQVLISGLVILADWIASNELLFPLCDIENPLFRLPSKIEMERRADAAWDRLKLTEPWEFNSDWMQDDFYNLRFGLNAGYFKPRPMQTLAKEIAESIDYPGIMIIEAPMGQGKTEAALAVAEIFAAKSECSGIFFALPTQATSNGIFPRIVRWVERLGSEKHTIQLAHGNAEFNDAFIDLFPTNSQIEADSTDEQRLFAHQWFSGRKKSMLADFVVGTVDQLLLMVLKQKHLMLRHVAFANKVVIIDECHAYDAYMNEYLHRALMWLAAYKVPVVILSATLPATQRRNLVEAYLQGRTADFEGFPDSGNTEWMTSQEYPLITYTDADKVMEQHLPSSPPEREVEICSLDWEALEDTVRGAISGGGCIGIVVNTVRRAQELGDQFRKAFGEDVVEVFHSAFLAQARADKESDLLLRLGKDQSHRPHTSIVIGTQVLEQSLDIDFDLLITDLCPMDLLIQRIGRLQRHKLKRPPGFERARCFVIDLDSDEVNRGSIYIYGSYLLRLTRDLLPSLLSLPGDIPRLVQAVYDGKYNELVHDINEDYSEDQKKYEELIERKKRKARSYKIEKPSLSDTMIGWNSDEPADHEGEASVRDGEPSIDVILVQQISEMQIKLIVSGEVVDINEVPKNDVAMLIARETLRLPLAITRWNEDVLIDELEEKAKQFSLFQESPWLKGSLILALDDLLCTKLCGFMLEYDMKLGLRYSKKENGDDSNL